MIRFNVRLPLVLLVCLLFASACGRSRPETLAGHDYDEQAMEQAIAQARSSVAGFIERLNRNEGGQFSVKVPIHEGENVEHFWLTDIRYEDGKFTGQIGNEPGVVTNVHFGQAWSVPQDEITDWMYMDEGRMYGNFTIRPLLETMPEAEAAHIRQILAD